MKEPLSWNYLWAGLCLMGAVYFIFRGREPMVHPWLFDSQLGINAYNSAPFSRQTYCFGE